MPNPGEAQNAPLDRAMIYLVAAFVWLYLAQDLAQISMDLDGVVYASIANMAAAGQGSFWQLPYFKAELDSFIDHPPLGIWLQSLWFALLGSAFWVEKLYCLLLTIVLSGLIMLLWREVRGGQGAWLPLFIFFLMPVATHALKNNTLDSLVAITSLFGVWCAWRGQRRQAFNVAVGLAAAAGCMVKGPVGLLPLAAPACLALVYGRGLKQVLLASFVSGSVFATVGGLVLLHDGAREMLAKYLDAQILGSLSGQRPALNGRGYILAQLAYNLLAPLLLVGAAWRAQKLAKPTRDFFALLAIGLLASLPLLISPRQFRHYLLPSLPFYALAAACLIKPLTLRWRPLWVRCALAAVCSLGLLRMMWAFGEPGRHAEELNDAALLAGYYTPGEPLVFCTEAIKLRAYLGRHHGVYSTAAGSAPPAPTLVCPAGAEPDGYTLQRELESGLSLWILAAEPR